MPPPVTCLINIYQTCPITLRLWAESPTVTSALSSIIHLLNWYHQFSQMNWWQLRDGRVGMEFPNLGFIRVHYKVHESPYRFLPYVNSLRGWVLVNGPPASQSTLHGFISTKQPIQITLGFQKFNSRKSTSNGDIWVLKLHEKNQDCCKWRWKWRRFQWKLYTLISHQSKTTLNFCKQGPMLVNLT